MTETQITRVTTSLGVVDNPQDRLDEIMARLREMDEDWNVGWDTHGAEATRLIEEAAEIQRAMDRAKRLGRVKQAAANPANREDGADPGEPRQAPAYVNRLGLSRIESADETMSRAGHVWRQEAGPIVHETAAGFVSRAHDALEAVEQRLTGDGAELLATLLTERRSTGGVSVRRSADEVRDAAEMILVLSNPYYESAMRSVFRNPDMFRSGVGHMVWSDDERQAVHSVMNNEMVRAAFAESSGATGAFALPLQLSPEIIFTNAGVASPHRNLARHELGTSNTWNGVTSAGATANWVAEGTAVTDTTPAIGQLVITPWKMMTWIYGSFEALDDTSLADQVPSLFNDARTASKAQRSPSAPAPRSRGGSSPARPPTPQPGRSPLR